MGQTGVSSNGLASLAELEAFLAAQPKWSTSASVFASYGYKDNLLLSFAGEEKSPLARGGVEMILLRVPQDRFHFSMMTEAVGTHYFEGKTVDQDSKVIFLAEPAYKLTDSIRLELPLRGYYYDQVFDVSDTEVERLVAELKVHGIAVGPQVRWDFLRSWWLEAQGVAQQKRYDDHAYDGEIGEGSVRLGWAAGEKLKIRLSGARRWHNFESRVQSSSSGRELLGTELKISEREGELLFDFTWDKAAEWKTTTRMSLVHYRDNGSGYFNYREQRIAHELDWDAPPWRVRIGGSAGRVDFAVQTVGLGIDPPARLRDEFSGELHIERQLSKRWTVLGTYTWERWRSNDPVASYSVNEGLLGVRWNWEK